MKYIQSLEDINIIIYILKTIFISVFTYKVALKSINKRNYRKYKNTIAYITIIFIAIFCGIVKFSSNSLNSIICLVTLVTLLFSKVTQEDIGYSILIVIFSLSINYSIFIISAAITFVPNVIFNIKNNYISLILIITCYSILINSFSKIKRFKKGFLFLQKKLKNEYFDILILNVSVTILFIIIIISNYKVKFTGNLIFGLIVSSIIMFITIQKSLQLYYKQKLLIQDLEETKEELEKKKQEIEHLEKENLNFSKISHSIAHKQKSLEHKLNELILKNETASEIDIKDRIDAISKELQIQTEVELSKTNIPEIDETYII